MRDRDDDELVHAVLRDEGDQPLPDLPGSADDRAAADKFVAEEPMSKAGIYDTVERDGTPTDHVKARMWKDTYHDARALMNVNARLRRLADGAPL